MTKTEKYNGWTNYETWNVALWIGNDQGSYEFWREKAQDVYDDATSDRYNTREEAAVHTLRESLKDSIEEQWQEIADASNIGVSMFADLMGAALSEVNWHEIAEHMIEDCDKDAEPEDDEDEDGEDVPEDFEVQVLDDDYVGLSRATCGTCGRSWDDSVITSRTPAPSGRCPFEDWH